MSLAFQMRCTLSGDIPTARAMVRTVHRVRGFGGCVAPVMTCSTFSGGRQGGRPRPFASCNPSNRQSSIVAPSRIGGSLLNRPRISEPERDAVRQSAYGLARFHLPSSAGSVQGQDELMRSRPIGRHDVIGKVLQLAAVRSVQAQSDHVPFPCRRRGGCAHAVDQPDVAGLRHTLACFQVWFADAIRDHRIGAQTFQRFLHLETVVTAQILVALQVVDMSRDWRCDTQDFGSRPPSLAAVQLNNE